MYICICNAITDRDIVRAAEAGARSADELAHQLGVGTGCGRCRACAKSLLLENVARLACNLGERASAAPRIVTSDALLRGDTQLAILHERTL